MEPDNPRNDAKPDGKSTVTVLLVLWLVAWGLHILLVGITIIYEFFPTPAIPASFTILSQGRETLLITPIAGNYSSGTWRSELPVLGVTDGSGQAVDERLHYPLPPGGSLTFRFNAADHIMPRTTL